MIPLIHKYSFSPQKKKKKKNHKYSYIFDLLTTQQALFFFLFLRIKRLNKLICVGKQFGQAKA